MENVLSRRNLLLGGSASLILAGCGSTSHQYSASFSHYEYVLLRPPGLDGLTFVDVAIIRFAVSTKAVMGTNGKPKPAYHMVNGQPVVSGVEYKNAFTKPALLEVAGMILPGLIPTAADYVMHRECLAQGCGDGSGGVFVFNQNRNNAGAQAAIEAGAKMSSGAKQKYHG